MVLLATSDLIYNILHKDIHSTYLAEKIYHFENFANGHTTLLL